MGLSRQCVASDTFFLSKIEVSRLKGNLNISYITLPERRENIFNQEEKRETKLS